MNQLVTNSLIGLFLISSLAIQVKVRGVDHSQEHGGLKQGIQAPEFTLRTMDGTSVSLSQYKGQTLVIDFFATWCGPCKQEMMALKAWHNKRLKHGQKPIPVLVISIDRDGDEVDRYLKNHTNPFILLHDPTSSVASQYNVKGVPTLYFIGKDGKIRFVQVGLSPGLTYYLDKLNDDKSDAPWRRP